MDRRLTRTKDGRYCTVEIRLENGRLSVTGEEGRVTTRPKAKKEALEYWRSFFEDNPGELIAMNQRCGKAFRSSLSAARFVLDSDGEFHGLDVDEAPDGSIRVLESCGCIHDTIREWFPELEPLIPWHLNDMKAGCEHQEALGWGRGRDVALSKDDLTPAQRESLEALAEKMAERERERTYKELAVKGDMRLLATLLGRNPSIHETETFRALARPFSVANMLAGSKEAKDLAAKLRAHVATLHPVQIESAVYKDSIGAPCPECGYRYGTAWLKRDLPPEIIALAEGKAA